MDQKLSDDSIRCASQIRALFKLLLSFTENEKTAMLARPLEWRNIRNKFRKI
jgi:hypothetical protein